MDSIKLSMRVTGENQVLSKPFGFARCILSWVSWLVSECVAAQLLLSNHSTHALHLTINAWPLLCDKFANRKQVYVRIKNSQTVLTASALQEHWQALNFTDIADISDWTPKPQPLPLFLGELLSLGQTWL